MSDKEKLEEAVSKLKLARQLLSTYFKDGEDGPIEQLVLSWEQSLII
jgi:hypothetical protein